MSCITDAGLVGIVIGAAGTSGATTFSAAIGFLATGNFLTSCWSRIFEIVPSTALPVRVVLRTLGCFSSAKRSSAAAFLASSTLGKGGMTSASLRCRSRRDGFGGASMRSRTLAFLGDLSLFSGIRSVCRVVGIDEVGMRKVGRLFVSCGDGTADDTVGAEEDGLGGFLGDF